MSWINLGLLRVFPGVILGLLLSVAQAETLDDAKELYEKKDYLAAISLLEVVIKKDPTHAESHHLLGKAYGRQAEISPWYKAIGLAKKTRKSLEKAVELDPKNISALRDLRKYYKSAPPFLGGGEDKAKMITKRLEALGEKVEEEDA